MATESIGVVVIALPGIRWLLRVPELESLLKRRRPCSRVKTEPMSAVYPKPVPKTASFAAWNRCSYENCGEVIKAE
jgi:hypothetical protein